MCEMDNFDFKEAFNQPDSPPSINQSDLFIKVPKLTEINTIEFSWAKAIQINSKYLEELSVQFADMDFDCMHMSIELILKIVEFIDLTTLSGDDTEAVVEKLTLLAIQPMNGVEWHSLPAWQLKVHTAAVCVYPARVQDVIKVLDTEKCRNIVKVASVAAGFPSGQYPMDTRLTEISHVVAAGADEVDIVIQRPLALTGLWTELFIETKRMRNVCGPTTHMKTILAVGDLHTPENIYAAAMVTMLAKSDFIKTSTGKEKVNANLPAGIIMCLAIKHYHEKTGNKVGLKPAGGISTFKDSVRWIYLVLSILGPDWLTPDLFRIGASSLLGNLLQEVRQMRESYQ